MPKNIKSKVRVPAANKRFKVIKFTSTRSNVKKVLESAVYSRENLKREIGNLEVKEFLGFLRNAKYQKFFEDFGNQKMSTFLDLNEKLFLEIMKREIYK